VDRDRSWLKTLLACVAVSAMSVAPLATTLAPTAQAWSRVLVHFRFRTPAERIWGLLGIGALLGTWIASFTLVLDWNEPWQAFPVPPLFGAWAGHALATCAVGVLSFQ